MDTRIAGHRVLRIDPRVALLLGCAAAAVATVFVLDPIAQDVAYHGLADRRTLLGIPNALNVLSNLPFALIGIWGLARSGALPASVPRVPWLVFCAGVAMVSAGSAWYHLAPDNNTLLWDRLPIAAAFMGLFCLVVADRVSDTLGRAMLWPCVAAALGAVLWWHLGEGRGAGDLRPYVLVQGIPMLLIPLILVLCREGVLRAPWMWGTLVAYGLAKLTEGADPDILLATRGLMSGHTLKHLLAAAAALFAMRGFLPAPMDLPVRASPARAGKSGAGDRSAGRPEEEQPGAG